MFHYSIAKYVDNIIVNESINIGIIISVPNTNKYIGKFIEIDKLKNIYPYTNLNLLKKVITTFKKYESNSSLFDLNKFKNQLQFTSPHVRDAPDMNTALNELFDKFIVIDNNFPTSNTKESNKKIIVIDKSFSTPNTIEFNKKIVERHHAMRALRLSVRLNSLRMPKIRVPPDVNSYKSISSKKHTLTSEVER